MSRNIDTVNMADSDFTTLLNSITRHDTNSRKAVCLAFRAAMNNLIYNHSVERLNQFRGVVASTAYWTKVRAAVTAFSGGFESDKKALKRYRNNELSIVRLHPREKVYEILPGADWQTAERKYEEVKTYDFDCLTLSTRPVEGSTLDKVTAQLRVLANNPEKWHPKQEKLIAQVLAAVGPALCIEVPAKAAELSMR